MTDTDAQASGARPSYVPIYAVMFGCMAAMMGFVAQAGSLARIFDLAPWQIGLTVTVSGLVWVRGCPEALLRGLPKARAIR